MLRISLLISFLLLLLACPGFAADDVAVIVNKENSNTIDRAMIGKIYLGYVSRWASGGTIVALEPPEDSPVAAAFATKVIGKPLRAIKDIWAQNVFTGKSVPPKALASDEEIKKRVAGSKNAIGYIKASSADNSVKVILTVN